MRLLSIVVYYESIKRELKRRLSIKRELKRRLSVFFCLEKEKRKKKKYVKANGHSSKACVQRSLTLRDRWLDLLVKASTTRISIPLS